MSRAEESPDESVDESGPERALVVITSGADHYHKPDEESGETAAEPACRAEPQENRRDDRGGWRLVDIETVDGWREPCEHEGCWGEVDHSRGSSHRAALLETDPDDLEALEDVEIGGGRWFS